MSNFIYNDNFSTSNDYEQNLISNDDSSEKKLSNRFLVTICIACAVFSLLFGVLGGVLVSRNMAPIKTDVYTNTIYRAPAASSIVAGDGESVALADVVELVRDSVVEIQTEYVIHSYYQAVRSGAGSGVIVGEYQLNGEKTGYNIITNAHVIQGQNANVVASKITVILRDGTQYNATCVGFDPEGDIAIIRIVEKENELTCASFASEDDLKVGNTVIAIGNPLGELGGSVTTGIVSALDREIQIDGNIMNLMQTNAAINPGNSGGGLFDTSGRLVGIVNAKSSGTGIEGLGFAIPGKDACKMYEDIINYGYVKDKATIGVVFAEYVDYSVRIYSLDKGYNEKVFRTGDKILTVNGESVSSASEINAIVRKCTIGSTLTFTIVRDKVPMTVEATVYEYVPNK
ncbi:MAG: trypsin-like peptidase domain-containing protein [Clostridia bacterium]|nr:trypsin-like peptidase domain-containing protein [Clostridia bacterium]